MIYKWKDGTKPEYQNHDATAIGEHLTSLMRRYGGTITSAIVLSDAKNTESPLHRVFEWDDTRAAVMYRKCQARELSNSLVVVRVDTRHNRVEEKPLLATVKISHSDGREHGTFTASEQTRANPHYRKQMVQRGLEELSRWCQRHSDMQEFNELLDAIEESWPDWGKDFSPTAKKGISA